MLKPALNSLVWYKGRPAFISELGEKITITLNQADGSAKTVEQIKVREKDIEVLHPGPLKGLDGLFPFNHAGESDTNAQTDIHGAWELIESGGVPVSLKDLTELAYGEFNIKNAWSARLLVAQSIYFSGTADAVKARSASEVAAAEDKRAGKAKEGQEREAFLERLKKRSIDKDKDARFLQDVEALACGKTAKSRTLKDLGRAETPQEAHRLLLDCGFWDKWVNPHPQRFGITITAKQTEDTPPLDACDHSPFQELARHDLCHLSAFAIDSPWSNDPDDCISLEVIDGKRVLYVHVADPASVITIDSPQDKAARERGATLYLAEGALPMLGERILERFALGLKNKPDEALSFKLTLNEDSSIQDVEIFPSLINVTRLTYEQADELAAQASAQTEQTDRVNAASILTQLLKIAQQNLDRRVNAGAVNISFPEIHLSARDHKVQVLPIVPYQSAFMVRECMLLAGEGAALWAGRQRIAFPYITQETGDLPSKPLPGLAGCCQIRRCMRPRAVSARPGPHWGLGLDAYCQVTSPLRRYTDLLAHQQIYAFLSGQANREHSKQTQPLNEEELLLHLAAGDAAAYAAVQAERASKLHWISVYLEEQKAAGVSKLWDAVITEKRPTGGMGVIIPELALETQIGGSGQLNDEIKLRFKSARLPELEITFSQE